MRQAGIPYGDAFLVQTPKTDAVNHEIFQDYLQNERQQKLEADRFDQQMAKEFSNVRSIDTPIVQDLWNKYRTARKSVLFGGNLKPEEYNKRDNAANLALSEFYNATSKSAELKKFYTDTMKDARIRGKNYQPDAMTRLNNLNNLSFNDIEKDPTLTDPESYLWKDTIDWNKLRTTAAGKESVVNSYDEKDPTGFQTRNVKSKYGANPLNFKSGIADGLRSQPNGAWSAAHQLDNYTPDQIAEINRQYYNETNSERWKNTTGQDKPMNVEPENPNDPIEQFSALAAKIHWLQTNPTSEPGSYQNVTKTVADNAQANKEKNMATQFDYNKTLAVLKNGLRLNTEKALLEMKDNKLNLNDSQKTEVAKTEVDRIENNARSQPAQEFVENGTNKKIKGYVLPPDKALSEELAGTKGIHKVPPNKLIVTDQGVRGLFKKTDDEGNVTWVMSDPLPKDSWVIVHRKNIFGNLGNQHSTTIPDAEPTKKKKPGSF